MAELGDLVVVEAEEAAQDFLVVLAEEGGVVAGPGVGFAEAPGGAWLFPGAHAWVWEFDPVLPAGEVGVVVDGNGIENATGGDVGAGEEFEGFLGVALGEGCGEPGVDDVVVGSVTGEYGVDAEEGSGSLPFGAGGEGDGEPLFVAGAAVDALGEDAGVAVAVVAGCFAAEGGGDEGFADEGGEDFALGEVDEGALAGAPTMDEG